MSSRFHIANEVKKKLDDISPSFCLAKWTQTTIHLGLGHTHSCHHPPPHKIPIHEIKEDPSALHNTCYKKSRRREMLNGIKPKECHYCWSVEDLNKPDLYSDRVLKSSENWSLPYFSQVLEAGWEENVNPRYLEVSFSNVCNFKCSYCTPSVSSQWMEEIERHGPYPTSKLYNNLDDLAQQDKLPILVREENPYIDAFWKWLPDIYDDLYAFRITGGEPILDKNLFRVLEFISNRPNKKLELAINTNLCVPDELYERFLEKIKYICENNLVKNVTLYTSCEAYGKQAEYIRFGLDYDKWYYNCKKYIEQIPNANLTVMATYNLLSVPSFLNFLKDFNNLDHYAFEINKGSSSVKLDIPHLSYPNHQAVKILTTDFVKFFDEQIEFMESKFSDNKSTQPGFTNIEIHKLIRVKNTFQEGTQKKSMWTEQCRKDFAIFVDEHDKRRKTNFLETFPEMKEFYDFCKNVVL